MVFDLGFAVRGGSASESSTTLDFVLVLETVRGAGVLVGAVSSGGIVDRFPVRECDDFDRLSGTSDSSSVSTTLLDFPLLFGVFMGRNSSSSSPLTKDLDLEWVVLRRVDRGGAAESVSSSSVCDWFLRDLVLGVLAPFLTVVERPLRGVLAVEPSGGSISSTGPS